MPQTQKALGYPKAFCLLDIVAFALNGLNATLPVQ
jgi:hypothetical protein